MAIYRVVKYGEEILRQKIKPTDFKKLQPLLPQLLADMEETCFAAKGAGLSANQIGLDYRLAVIFVPESSQKGAPLKRYVLINPQIIELRGKVIDEEGCLSLPGLWVEIERAADVTVEYTDENGEPVRLRARGLLAKALQHEIDHLDGKLFIDYADPQLKPAVKKEIKKLRTNWD